MPLSARPRRTRAQDVALSSLVFRGSLPAAISRCEDLVPMVERLQLSDAEVSQGPYDQPEVRDRAFRDPSGHLVRIPRASWVDASSWLLVTLARTYFRRG